MPYRLLKWVQLHALYPVFYAIPRWWAVLLALYGGYEQQWMGRCIEASKKIEAGDSEADVVSILGRPIERFDKRSEAASAFFGSVPRKWAYGPILDLDFLFAPDLPFPNPIPLRFRLWSPDAKDLVVEWNDKNTVLRVVKPKLPAPAPKPSNKPKK